MRNQKLQCPFSPWSILTKISTLPQPIDLLKLVLNLSCTSYKLYFSGSKHIRLFLHQSGTSLLYFSGSKHIRLFLHQSGTSLTLFYNLTSISFPATPGDETPTNSEFLTLFLVCAAVDHL